MPASTSDLRSVNYELEIEINAAPDVVWRAMTDETNAWWLADFHMVSPESTVAFELRAGGALIEQDAAGGALQWYTVQMVQPAARRLDLVGHLGPDWGGPATSHLSLTIEARGDGSVLRVRDVLVGAVDDATATSLEGGWRTLFTDGLKRHAESNSSPA